MVAKILRLPEVMARTGLKRSSIYSAISQGLFPKQVRLGKRMVGWREDDVEAWLDGLSTVAPDNGGQCDD